MWRVNRDRVDSGECRIRSYCRNMFNPLAALSTNLRPVRDTIPVRNNRYDILAEYSLKSCN
jgi:hypothetical protein